MCIRDSSYTVCELETSRDPLIKPSRDVSSYAHIHCISSRYVLSYVHTLRDTYIIMHKRVYTVTLDIECWDDLKVEKIDWAKSINLFPDEYIHSSVQDRATGTTVDRT